MSCQLDGGAGLAIEQRLKALVDLGLLEAQTIPVFEEATQTAAHLSETPICILGFLDQNRFCFKSAVGLSRLGLMNQLAQSRQLPRQEALCAQVVESQQVLVIKDTLSSPVVAKSVLVQRYGIRAYLGVPLFNAAGLCLGAIAVMDLEPRPWNHQHAKFLELIARWSMSEFERNWLLQGRNISYSPLERGNILTSTELVITPGAQIPAIPAASLPSLPQPTAIIHIKLELIDQLTQELRSPLTTILGMANVVGRQIYGPLTNKQKEYLEIIQTSGRHLLTLVNEISLLGNIKDLDQALNPTSVDIEMLCQQVVNSLEEIAKRREQQIRLSLEQGRSRIWVLDKERVKQLLYHLLSCMIQTAATGSLIRIHVLPKGGSLNLSVSISHPWMGEGLTPIAPHLCQLSAVVVSKYTEAAAHYSTYLQEELPVEVNANSEPLANDSSTELVPSLNNDRSGAGLRFLLSRELAELLGGQISVQGTPESGYRYVASLPELTLAEAG